MTGYMEKNLDSKCCHWMATGGISEALMLSVLACQEEATLFLIA